MASVYEVDCSEQLVLIQAAASQAIKVGPDPRALTSPRLLRQLLESKLPELASNCDCENHEMLLVPSQTFTNKDLIFVSVVCARCQYHFHVKTDIRSCLPDSPTHCCHMLIPCVSKTTRELEVEKSAYNDTVGCARYICACATCLFNIEIHITPPRISQDDAAKFADMNRLTRNLTQAQVEDPDRYSEYNIGQLHSSGRMLHKYLEDALDNTDMSPLRINKRNKKFLVCIRNDFNDLLKFLGFYEGEDAVTGEPCWYITIPEVPQTTTAIRTLRARMEDAVVELRILTAMPTMPAWENLKEAFKAEFPSQGMDINYRTTVRESDLTLLGCLIGYPPEYFSWAAILLAQLRSDERDKYLDAGLRCIQNRSDDASTDIIIYKSQFDDEPSVNIGLDKALEFFNTTRGDGMMADWFLERYYELARSNPTDEFKAQAQQHLEAIGNHMGEDIVSHIDPSLLESVGGSGLMTTSPDSSFGRMSVDSAAKVLNVEPNYTAEIIRGFVDQLVNDRTVDRSKIIEAVDVLSGFKRLQDKLEEAVELQQIAEFVKETGDVPIMLPQLQPMPQSVTANNTPPGLKNIGNTCYLNSLLQYFFNVKVVHELVFNFNKLKIALDPEVISQRRTGGNGTSVSLDEAIVAIQFVEMLEGLFNELHTTYDIAAQPSQKLANTALSSARDILDPPQMKPPPLPARPSPAPPLSAEAEDEVTIIKIDTMGNVTAEKRGAVKKTVSDMVNITVESVNDQLETASSQSSRTLVDDDTSMPLVHDPTEKDPAVIHSEVDADTPMEDAAESWSLEKKYEQVSRRLEQSDRSGTSQQDVGEIIGNILEHLMRAIRPSGPMPEKPELQADKITETFFTTIVNYTVMTKKGNPTNRSASHPEETPLSVEIVPERWITAYPEEADQASDGVRNNASAPDMVRCTLYQALDRYFSYESIDNGNRARYSSIKSLPPIVHICIQRSTPEGKNKNPVIIPEFLFLDRYMEAEKGSRVWLSRKRAWALKERIKTLQSKSAQGVQDNPARSTGIMTSESGPPWSSDGQSGSFDDQEFHDVDNKDLATMVETALEPSLEPIVQELLEDTGVQKGKIPESLELTAAERNLAGGLSAIQSLSDLLTAIDEETSKSLDNQNQQEIIDLRQKEEEIFDGMTNEKYSIHAVICHRGGTAAGHYWVWIRDFDHNVWYRYNDETVTRDSRGTEAVLKDLNETGDPYYVAYVRDEIKTDLVEVPQRIEPETGDDPATFSGVDVPDIEMIDGIPLDPRLR
ncbi:cysteine proteinase [Hypoxylon sp. NC1633]|nr:cysteine proteinase [Hypoxylon sp. NC1633]